MTIKVKEKTERKEKREIYCQSDDQDQQCEMKFRGKSDLVQASSQLWFYFSREEDIYMTS